MDQGHPRILVIDDERHIRELLEMGLSQAKFSVVAVADGPTALKAVSESLWDAIICDVMLPQIDGITLLPQLRRITEAPILMLSAKGDVDDRIAGLKLGADDYIAKPFSLDELIVRLEAALRRPLLAEPLHLQYEDLHVNLKTRIVTRSDREIELSAREFDLLVTLLRSPFQVFSRDQLIQCVWGLDRDVKPGNVETYISYLRAKIDFGTERKLIQTIRGVGYSLR